MTSICFWQNSLSLHQAPLLRALAALPHVSVQLMADGEVPERRKQMGWEMPDFGDVAIHVRPTEQEIEAQLRRRDMVHIFSGPRGNAFVWSAFKRACAVGARIGLMSETSDMAGFKGMLRLLRGYTTIGRFVPHVEFILPIGPEARTWFSRLGFSRDIMYPFGYFLAPPPTAEAPAPNERFRILYVGRLIRLKGVDLLIQALSQLTSHPWECSIIGDGPETQRLVDLARQHGLAQRIHFHGTLPHTLLDKHYQSADLLVLPTRLKEGWGAVAAESLGWGTPVVCSNRCGVSDVFQDTDVGTTFQAGDVSELRQILATRIANGPLEHARRASIQRWATCLHATSIAPYLVDILEFSSRRRATRPNPPWVGLTQ